MEKENFNADLPSADAPKYRKFKPPFSSGTTESPGAEALNRVVFGAPPRASLLVAASTRRD